MIPGFRDGVTDNNGGRIAYSTGGDGPPVLLLHGFPQTRALWAKIGPRLAKTHTVVCADLRGYGDSFKPATVREYSFRAMGEDMLALMAEFGHQRFDLVGHDRGARTAHRMALDAPERIRSLTLMDIIPTHLLLDRLTWPVAKGYYHWFFLSQLAPFPETLITADPDFYFENCLSGWGAAHLADFDPIQLSAYRKAWRDPDTIRGMCNDYRAALEMDFAMDAADLGKKVSCPTQIMWGATGAMGQAYDVPATWAERCADLYCAPIEGGHFFVDTAPEQTADALTAFLTL